MATPGAFSALESVAVPTDAGDVQAVAAAVAAGTVEAQNIVQAYV